MCQQLVLCCCTDGNSDFNYPMCLYVFLLCVNCFILMCVFDVISNQQTRRTRPELPGNVAGSNKLLGQCHWSRALINMSVLIHHESLF